MLDKHGRLLRSAAYDWRSRHRGRARSGKYGSEIPDPRIRTIAEELITALNQWTRARSRDEIFHQAQQWRVPMGKVSTVDEVTRLEQLKERSYFDEIEHPIAGRRIYPGMPVRFGERRPRSTRAPLLGEHTADILCTELGYTREDVIALMNLQVV